MSEILGRVTTASHEIPRGADVSLKISVPPRWLDEGRTIEVELPRNLNCAKCGGGGCGACDNAGAITLRSRNELPELVQVVLPLSSLVDSTLSSAANDPPSKRSGANTVPDSGPRSDRRAVGAKSIVIRVPECGGLPDSSKGQFIRGWLLLQVETAAEASSNVTTLEDDAIDSSKLVRAVVRSSGKCATGPSFKAVPLPRRSRSSPAQPESTTRGTSGLPRPRSDSPQLQKRAESVSLADTLSSAPIAPIKPRTRTPSARWIYLGVALLLAVMVALFLLR